MGMDKRGSASAWGIRAFTIVIALISTGTLLGADIPNGYVDGRTDVKYGTYYTKVQPSAQPFQERLKDLENKAYGLAAMFGNDPIVQSEAAHWLEFQIIRLHFDIADAPKTQLSNFERKALLYGTIKTYEDVRHHSERLYENMVRYIDHKIPGPNGQQVREENAEGKKSIYYPNYRSDKDLSDAEKEAAYKQKVDDFLKNGGSWDEMHRLDVNSIKKMGAYTYMEYAWLANGGHVMVTEGKAGHLLLAKGHPVKAAGQIVILKNKAGKITLVIVSNASGTFKPDLLNAQELADKLKVDLNLPQETFVVTKGEPLSTQAVKIYMKANGVAADTIKKKVKELEALSQSILTAKAERSALVNCGNVFNL